MIERNQLEAIRSSSSNLFFKKPPGGEEPGRIARILLRGEDAVNSGSLAVDALNCSIQSEGCVFVGHRSRQVAH
jgi:hypothetical protein